MSNIEFIITIIQILVSVILTILILTQSSSEVSGVFGGGDQGGFYQTRRGFEKGVFIATIILTIIFTGLALLNLVLPNLQNLF